MKGNNASGGIHGNTHIRQGGSNQHRPDNKDNLDSRGDLEINEEPSGNNEKELHIGKKNKHNDPQGESPNKPDKAG
jgi:hypothetical protein